MKPRIYCHCGRALVEHRSGLFFCTTCAQKPEQACTQWAETAANAINEKIADIVCNTLKTGVDELIASLDTVTDLQALEERTRTGVQSPSLPDATGTPNADMEE